MISPDRLKYLFKQYDQRCASASEINELSGLMNDATGYDAVIHLFLMEMQEQQEGAPPSSNSQQQQIAIDS